MKSNRFKYFLLALLLTQSASAITISTNATDCSLSSGTYSGAGCNVNTSDLATELANGDVSIVESTNDISIDNAISYSGVARTLTLKAPRDIVLADSVSISSTSDKLNIVFWSDSDGNSDGGVVFQSPQYSQGASVVTNGGHLWIGGGSGSTTWNGLTVGDSSTGKANNHDTVSTSVIAPGINLSNAVINSDSGDIYMSGKSGQTTYNYGVGVRIVGQTFGTRIIGNNITLIGTASANSGSNKGNWGIDIEHNANVTATGDITIEGTGGGSSSSGDINHGVNIASTAKVEATGSGDINITGTGGGGTGTNNDGVSIASNAQIITESGDITITGTKGVNANSQGVSLSAGATDKQIKSTNGGTITIVTDDLTIGSTQRLSSSGNLIIKPKTANTTIGVGGASGTLAIASSYFSTNFVDGFANVIIGDSSTSDITIGGTTTYNDNLTFKTKGDIFTDASTSLTASGASSLVFWSDIDGNENGSIYLKDTTSITTNGGHLWMGGGDGSTTWNGLTVGDDYSYAGTTHSSFNGSLNYRNGISLDNSTINTGAGNIALYSKSLDTTTSTLNGSNAILMEQSTINSTSGNIAVSAITQNTNANTSWNYGLLMSTNVAGASTTAITSTTGTIEINAQTSFQKDTHGSAIGLYSFNNASSVIKIQSTSGAINVTGALNSTGFNNQYGGIFLYGSGKEMIVSQTGDISLTGNSANSNVYGINVFTGNTTSYIGYDGTNAYSGDITFNSNTKISFEGAIVASTLNLLGSGVNYTLESSSNDVDTLTANTGKVVFVDSDALTLGAISATDIIDVASVSGDITINGNIATTDTTNSAITINAGKSENAGTSGGGDIIHTSGTVTTGGGSGRATLYGGLETNALRTLVGGSSNTYYNSDESSTLSNISNGKYAVYREIETRVTSIDRKTPTTITTNTDSVVFTITFNKSVSNIDTSDFIVSGTTGTVTNVSASSGTTIDVTVSGGDIASYDGTVTIDFANNQNILYNTTITGTSNNSYTLDNTLPTLSNISITSNNQDTTKATIADVITLTFTASETLNSDPTVTIAGQSATIDNTNAPIYTASYTMQNSDTEGVVGFTIDFTDVAGNSGIQVTTTSNSSSVTFHLDLSNINNSPTFDTNLTSQTILEDTGILTFEINATDTEGDDLNITVESNNSNILTISPSWSGLLNQANYSQPLDFNISTVENANGMVQITIITNDGDKNSTSIFDINVSSVNDAPELSKISDMYIYKNSTSQNIMLNATDVDSNDLNYASTYSNSDLISSIDFVDNNMTININEDQTGDSDINITVSDGELNTSRVFKFKILVFNQDENIKEGGDVSVDENETVIVTFEEDNITIKAPTVANDDGSWYHEINIDGNKVVATSELNGTVVELTEDGVHTKYENNTTKAEVNATIDGYAIHTLSKNGKTTTATSKYVGANTVIKEDSNGSIQIETSVQIDNQTSLSVIAKEDGTAEHIVKTGTKTTKAISKLEGTTTTINEIGNTQTSAGNVLSDDNLYIIKAIIDTDVNGKSKTSFVKINKTNPTDVGILSNTIIPQESFEAGNQAQIDQIDGKLFIRIDSSLESDLVIE